MFFNERFIISIMVARHEEGCYENAIFTFFLVCEGLSTNQSTTSGWRGSPFFRRYGGELISKPAISLKKSWGGYSSKTHSTVGVERSSSDELQKNEQHPLPYKTCLLETIWIAVKKVQAMIMLLNMWPWYLCCSCRSRTNTLADGMSRSARAS